VRVDEHAALLPCGAAATAARGGDDTEREGTCAAASAAVLSATDAAAAAAVREQLQRLLAHTAHTRRVLGGGRGAAAAAPLRADELAALRGRCADLKAAALQLSDHCALAAPSLDAPTHRRVAEHIDALDAQLRAVHAGAARVLQPLRGGAAAEGCHAADAECSSDEEDDENAVFAHAAPRGLPWGTVVPVLVDSLMDGFLIGLFCAVRRRAGVVLAAAAAVEMAFLGAVHASAVRRARGAPAAARVAAVVAPPLLLVGAAAAGAAAGAAAAASAPGLLVALLAFGAVALLFLVTHELLIDAHETNKAEAEAAAARSFGGGGGASPSAAPSSAGAWLFVGVFLVLQLNRLLPLEGVGEGAALHEARYDYDYET
jgi:hypothetical protein